MVTPVSAGKPVVFIHEHFCDLRVSEHCIDGVIDALRRLNPNLTHSDLDGISYCIHLAIKDYLLASFVIAHRRDRAGLKQIVTRAPGSPIGPLRRMQAAAERRDYKSFSKNFHLLSRNDERALHLIINDELWDHRGAGTVYPLMAGFRENCQKVGFLNATYFRFGRDRFADVDDINLLLSFAIARLKTKGRRPFPERDRAAAEVILRYFGFIFGDWTKPRQPSHIIGDSRRDGPLIAFIEAVERSYGIEKPRLQLISRSSGSAWARVNLIVAEKMGLPGAV